MQSGRATPDLRARWALALVALAALAVRAATVWALSSPLEERVTYEHGEIAENLLAGRGFTVRFLGAEGPTSQQAPLYPVMLAGCYAIFGVGSHAAILAMQFLQCLAGMGIVLASFWLARNLVPKAPSVAWTAAILAAFFPPHIYMVTHIQVVVWATLVLVVLLALVTTPRLQGTRGGAILAGLVSGLLLLVDPILVLALPVAALAFWLGTGEVDKARWSEPAPSRSPALAHAVLMGAVALAVISPWLVRNRMVHGEWVFIKSSFGYALWQGNNPHSWGTDKIPKPEAQQMLTNHDGSVAGWHRALWEARHETLYIDDVLLTEQDYREFAALSEPARSRRLGDRAWAFIAAQPARYAELCLARLGYFLGLDPTNPKTAHPVYRASTAVWLIFTALGLLVSRPHWRSIWPTLAVFGAIALFHALTITSVRFRIPLEPLTFVWAGLAIGPLLGRLLAELSERVHAEEIQEDADTVAMPQRKQRRAAPRKKSAA
jgi:hypothetical protein